MVVSPHAQLTLVVVCRAYRDHDLFATDDNRLGLGPQKIEVGDEIWLVAGYRVVDTAYVHGIIDGEEAKDLPDEVLTRIGLW
ncbi:hypothetical protein B0T25DRAFT_546053 [Lasiosphaeria hispida]|uniref:Uncharacterized protein n=1 Tax=Lasiosphaeria hispida TaxID=260671 RepID=A0AAJ0HDI1_9PEZI|nr:hypothetical protein B0T25DRAFT_546053 [Lasiosphaeria hispida]